MDRPRSGRLLALSVALLLAGVLAERCREERYLPSTLSAFPELSRTHELHLHGDFRANLTQSHEIVFELAETSYMRIYLAPKKVDIDLYLFRVQGDNKQQVVRFRPLFGPLYLPPYHHSHLWPRCAYALLSNGLGIEHFIPTSREVSRFSLYSLFVGVFN